MSTLTLKLKFFHFIRESPTEVKVVDAEVPDLAVDPNQGSGIGFTRMNMVPHIQALYGSAIKYNHVRLWVPLKEAKPDTEFVLKKGDYACLTVNREWTASSWASRGFGDLTSLTIVIEPYENSVWLYEQVQIDSELAPKPYDTTGTILANTATNNTFGGGNNRGPPPTNPMKSSYDSDLERAIAASLADCPDPFAGADFEENTKTQQPPKDPREHYGGHPGGRDHRDHRGNKNHFDREYEFENQHRGPKDREYGGGGHRDSHPNAAHKISPPVPIPAPAPQPVVIDFEGLYLPKEEAQTLWSRVHHEEDIYVAAMDDMQYDDDEDCELVVHSDD